jgi:outer membrane lipoprotein-sorting protein
MLPAFWIGLLSSTFVLAAGGELDTTLARMDRAAVMFKGLSADISRTHHVAVIDENTEDKGSILIKRPKPHELLMFVDIKMPDPMQVAVDAKKAEIYYPKSKTEQIYDIGPYKKQADQLLLLGFGTTSKELASGYTVTLGGPDMVNGQKTTRLDLTPKSTEMHLTKVELWISDETGLPIQQKLDFTGGEYNLATYTNIKVNPNIPDSALKLRVPAGAKIEHPQN